MISEDVKAFAADFEERLPGLLPPVDDQAVILDESMQYSMLAGGRRLRPMLMAAAFEAYSGRDWHEDRLAPFYMAALEMIHTYSLIHDDLPAMDDDDMRRGQRTNHIVFGEDMAILAGDALLNGAFELMSSASCTAAGNGHTQEAVRGAFAMHKIALYAGGRGMIAGQVMDVTQRATKLSRIIRMYEEKTGALLAAAIVGGAILGGAPEEDCDILQKAALDAGLAFQIQDDILDIAGDEVLTGKPVGSDDKSDKLTYVSMVGLEQAETDAARYTAEAIGGLESLNKDLTIVQAVIRGLIGRQA